MISVASSAVRGLHRYMFTIEYSGPCNVHIRQREVEALRLSLGGESRVQADTDWRGILLLWCGASPLVLISMVT